MVRWQGEIKQVKDKDDSSSENDNQEDDSSKVKDVVVVESGEEVVSRRAMLMLSVVSFGGSMVFWSQNITGNAVLEFGKSSANWVGGILFVLSIIGFLAYVQRRKK